jgi:thioredoxin 1
MPPAYHAAAAGAQVLSSLSALCYGSPMADVLAVSDDSFEREVLQSATPVLVDFWAPWCAPCRAIAPIVDELSREYDGKLKVVKMNVDENPRTPSQYGVRGIPTLLLIQGGQVKQQLVGAQPKAKLVSAIGNVVAVA